ncbi:MULTISPECIES: helix-turn-helix domain-containing protein [Bacillus cereus group]|uniref:helix-turn-helix domain-containing protein n=1 Tax=Bacillus cereus group TaxID=86661 RepID=UPI0018CFC9CB|nr:helix-turn-helix domain-containing protein [Bacillus thuringiensis]MBG9520235.1 DNA-binding protein [Bacillus thuringiensis]
MRYDLKSREEVEDFIRNEVLTAPEAIEILDITRARMSQLIKQGKITPVKKLDKVSLFLRADVEEKRKELEVLREKYQPYNSANEDD